MNEETPVEARLEPTEKVLSLQRFAAGIAHDLNNKLAIVVGNLDLAEMDISPDSPAMGSLGEVRSAIDAIQGMIGFLTDYASPPSLSLASVDVRDIVEGALGSAPARTVRCALPGAPCLAECDRSETIAVLSALLSNAQWASSGGVIEVSVRRMEAEAGIDAYFKQLPPGSYIEVSVKDSGPGMNRETVRSMFDPYFTCSPTKRRGLGLARTLLTLDQMGGGAVVESRAGQGTTVRLYLKAVAV